MNNLLWCATVPINVEASTFRTLSGETADLNIAVSMGTISAANNEYPVLKFEALEFRVLNINKSAKNYSPNMLDIIMRIFYLY
jgi:hypothetical protein